jgi:hypothetical protein
MKVKEYPLLQQCVETGISLGYTRAYKHTDTPSEDMIKEKIFDAVMGEISDWFTFDIDYSE